MKSGWICRNRGGLRAGEKEIAFAGIASEGSGALKFFEGFRETAELEKKIAPHAGEEMVILESRIRGESVDEFEAGGWTGGHGDGDGAIQFDYGRRREARKLFVKNGDARPVGFFGGAGTGVARGDCGLQNVGSRCA